MVFNGEVRSLFQQITIILQMNTQIFTVLTYLMNINQNSLGAADRQWQQKRKTVFTIVIWAFLLLRETSSVLLACVINWIILHRWHVGKKSRNYRRLFLLGLITNVIPISSYQPQHTNVCFWYIPPSLRGLPDGDERKKRLHKVMTRHYFFALFPVVLPSQIDLCMHVNVSIHTVKQSLTVYADACILQHLAFDVQCST